MAKTRTPEQEAISRAKKQPERKGFASRKMAWAFGDRWFPWGFFTDWTSFSVSVGQVGGRSEKETCPMPVFLFSFGVAPFSVSVFWCNKRLIWIGDWGWKKGMRIA